MAKQPLPRGSAGGGGDRSSADSVTYQKRAVSLLEQILAKVKDQNSRAEKAERNDGAAKQRKGAGGGGGEKDDSKRDRWGRTADQRKANLRQNMMSGAASGIGSALSAFLTPQITDREKEYQATRGLAVEGAASFAIAGADWAGASEAMQMRLGQAAGEMVGSAVDAAFHPVTTKTAQARGGFADLESMAAQGIDISDEMIAQRAQTTYEQADRAYNFRDKREAALNVVNRGDFDEAKGNAAQGVSEATERLKQDMLGLSEAMAESRRKLENDDSDNYRSRSAG